jgi:hypothetical protein
VHFILRYASGERAKTVPVTNERRKNCYRFSIAALTGVKVPVFHSIENRYIDDLELRTGKDTLREASDGNSTPD